MSGLLLLAGLLLLYLLLGLLLGLGFDPSPGSVEFYSRFRNSFRTLGHRSGRTG